MGFLIANELEMRSAEAFFFFFLATYGCLISKELRVKELKFEENTSVSLRRTTALLRRHQRYIGKVKHAVFHTQKTGRKRVIVSTEENVVASLDLRLGEICKNSANHKYLPL